MESAVKILEKYLWRSSFIATFHAISLNFFIDIFPGFLLQIAEHKFSRIPLSQCFRHFILGSIQSYISQVLWSTWYSKIVEIAFFVYRNINVQKKNHWEKKEQKIIKTSKLQMCSYEKVFWKTWSKFTGEHPCWKVISIKWQLYRNHTSTWVLSCKFDAYFSEHFFTWTPFQNCFWIFFYFCFFILFLLSYVNK